MFLTGVWLKSKDTHGGKGMRLTPTMLHGFVDYPVGCLDNIPFGAAMNKGLTIRTDQPHLNRYLLDLLHLIEEGDIITHRAKPEDGPALYENFRDKEDNCIKVVLTA